MAAFVIRWRVTCVSRTVEKSHMRGRLKSNTNTIQIQIQIQIHIDFSTSNLTYECNALKMAQTPHFVQ